MRKTFYALGLALTCATAAWAADSSADLQRIVALDSELHRATQALLAGDESALPAAKALLDRVDSANALSSQTDTRSIETRDKRDALRGPTYNLKLLLDQPEAATRSLSALSSLAKVQAPLISAESVSGTECFGAMELVEGQPLRIEMPAGSSRWFSVRAPLEDIHALAVTTVGSEIDAALDVYTDCRETGKAPLSSGDDNYGLQAIASIPRASHPLLVQLRNTGEQGIATIRTVTAVTINGRVTRSDTGTPIASKRVVAYVGTSPSSAGFATGAYALGDGTYQLNVFGSVASNTYVRTESPFSRDALDEAWDNIPCSQSFDLSSCGPGVPSAAATMNGVVVSNIDFALSPGATIYGQVRDRSGNPVTNARVSVNPVGNPVNALEVFADELGRYRISALPNGQYRVVATAFGFKSQVFREFDCPADCGGIAGTPVFATEFGLSQADFALSRGGSIRVTPTVEGQPLTSNQAVTVLALDASGAVVATALAGRFSPPTAELGPLAAGSYRVRAEGEELVSEYYQDVACPDECGTAQFQAALAIAVSDNSPAAELAMDLGRTPELTGRVTSTSGEPIVDATVRLDGDFRSAQTRTGFDGIYRIRAPSTGQYRVYAISPKHIDELHANIPCDSGSNPSPCPGATLVDFGAGSMPAPVDFELAPSAGVRGRVLSFSQNPFFPIRALTATHQETGAGQFTAFANGRYELSDLPDQTFRFGYMGTGRLQLFDHIDCGPDAFMFSQCPTAGPTSVSLASGQLLEGIDFTHRSRYGRQGRITDEATGSPLAGIIVDAFDPQSGQRVQSVVTDSDGQFEIPVDFGTPTLTIATDNYQGYINEVYDNRPCASGSVYLGTCSLAGATPVAFPGDGSPLNIALRAPDLIFRSGFE